MATTSRCFVECGNWLSILRKRQAKVPHKENKPHAPGVMSNICVPKVPARILGEPILQFNDDSSDAFNQFHLHPSQIYMTSILWLKLHIIASKCEYSHILDHSFGFGYSNASYFCQRFGTTPCFIWSLTARWRRVRGGFLPFVRDRGCLRLHACWRVQCARACVSESCVRAACV